MAKKGKFIRNFRNTIAGFEILKEKNRRNIFCVNNNIDTSEVNCVQQKQQQQSLKWTVTHFCVRARFMCFAK